MSEVHFTQESRTILTALLRFKRTQVEIAQELGKTKGAISKEISRNIDEDGIYRARSAQKKAIKRRISANQRFRKIENNAKLQEYIVVHLRLYWSPEQVAGRWRKEEESIIHHETIYRWIYVHRKDLVRYLRCQKGKYRRRRGTKIREKQREKMKKKRIDTRLKQGGVLVTGRVILS